MIITGRRFSPFVQLKCEENPVGNGCFSPVPYARETWIEDSASEALEAVGGSISLQTVGLMI
jgi:hypothetical protein